MKRNHGVIYYVRAVQIAFRSFAYYPVDSISNLAGYALSEFGSVAAILVVIWRFHSIDGWTLRPLLVLVAIRIAVTGIRATFTRSLLSIPSMIQDGSFDNLLVRPTHPLILTLVRPGSHYVGMDSILSVPALIAALAFAGIRWSPGTVLLLLCTLLGGVLLFLAVDITIVSQALWSGQSVEGGQVHWTLMYIQEQYSQYPLSVFSKWIQIVMTYAFPFGFVSFFPARLLVQGGIHYPAPVWYGWLTLPIGLFLALMATQVWNAGMRRYTGSGS